MDLRDGQLYHDDGFDTPQLWRAGGGLHEARAEGCSPAVFWALIKTRQSLMGSNSACSDV